MYVLDMVMGAVRIKRKYTNESRDRLKILWVQMLQLKSCDVDQII